jgi:hypothetical protein
MKNNNKITPVGLKGREINERMISLMGIKPVTENNSKYVIELTKIGPDGKAYAIVRENHEYYIKITDKTSNLLGEDFKYIGGLQNKKQEAYPSYAKAIKMLNLKFNSLCEANNIETELNLFIDDNLVSEGKTNRYDKDDEDYDVTYDDSEEELDETQQAVHDIVNEKKEIAKPIQKEHKLSIARSIEKMDSIIDSLTESKKKVYTLK